MSSREQSTGANEPVTPPWHRFPPIDVPAPAIALAAGAQGIWAGGLGGVARYREDDGWAPARLGLSPRSVTALAQDEGVLLAAGEGGITRSGDHGRTWQSCLAPGAGIVTALALSPRFAEDGTALAGTLDSGIFRSSDGGRSWQSASFGLPSPEVLALAWGAGETMVAATAGGLARSPNGGRAWRACGPAGATFTALAALADGEALAAPEAGPLLRSSGNFTHWSPCDGLPGEIRIAAVAALRGGRLLLGTVDHGILLSLDDGATWSPVSPARALCFASDEAGLYAGTSTGIIQSQDGGKTWSPLPPAPLQDYRQILLLDGVPLIAGAHSPPVVNSVVGEWSLLTATPLPLTALGKTSSGALLASTPHGLYRSADRGVSWEAVVPGEGGRLTQMTFAADGGGWGGVTGDGALLRTSDDGLTWQRLTSPFGVLPLVALQALPGLGGSRAPSLVAATYDERRRAVSVWRSDDGGERWTRGGDSFTSWPIVATAETPPLLAIGNVITIRQPDGTWRETTVGEPGVRRVASDGTTIAVLTGDGLWCSDDLGTSWQRADAGLPLDQIADIALAEDRLFVLLAGGRLWARSI